MKKDLLELRKIIDRTNILIMKTLNFRAEVVWEIFKYKKSKNITLFDAEREEEMLEYIRKSNPGPLPTSALENIFRHVFNLSFSIDSTD